LYIGFIFIGCPLKQYGLSPPRQTFWMGKH